MEKDIQRCFKCNSEVYDVFQDNLFHNCKGPFLLETAQNIWNLRACVA